ncbi:ATP-binding protein [Phytohabitans houttuyneae]|uniref:Uncharacterized protein n=1 Tax=Phytohabitans houttuyneae TaxID=1076126 RepID=A0A6V8JXI7_9ACTN|nr:ATP-binding protein [Phytohabitans houttuyneae]GFJ77473.1 hypothetical protein Phou_016530 [Phytohabitans houttuyneae]
MLVYNEHDNDIGEVCPHSGQPAPGGHDTDRCPARCRDSRVIYTAPDDDEADLELRREMAVLGELTYPISPNYVKSWTAVRAIAELIANALDEDPQPHVAWADGTLTIADNGPGIPEEGLILGESTKTAQQIGQFGEGKKIACLVLARHPDIRAVQIDTAGYGILPTVQRGRLLGGQLPSRNEQGAEMLTYQVYGNTRGHGTTVTIECPQHLAVEAIGRFRALTEPHYTPPAAPGACVLAAEPGQVWIGGVLVNTIPGLLASYDLPLTGKHLQNRDRTVIDAGSLRDAVRDILATSQDQTVIGRFAQHVLAGNGLREPEQFFAHVTRPRVRAAWRTWARANLPTKTFYTRSGDEEATLDLQDQGFTHVSARGLPAHQQRALMDLLGVDVARTRQRRHYDKTRNKTTWVAEHDLTVAQRALLHQSQQLVRAAIGAFALGRVRVFSASEELPCALGIYHPRTGDVAIHIDALADRHLTLTALVHEAGHRVGHRGGGRWTPIPDFQDRSRGFEQLLSEFAGILLHHLADAGTLAAIAPTTQPDAGGGAPDADAAAAPASRRELARLLTDRLPHALADKAFASEKDLVASTGVHPEVWRTLVKPRAAGYRRMWGAGGRAWDYDKVALLAEAVGVAAPVVWLGYNLCEGPIYGRQRQHWNRPGPWSKRMREATLRACADLQTLGGAYAAQVPALHALVDGRTPAVLGDDSWQAPARTLIALERERLRLDTPGPRPASPDRRQGQRKHRDATPPPK